jgi:hypothetical protein
VLGSFAKSFFELITFNYVIDYTRRDTCVTNPDHDGTFSFMFDDKISIFGHFIVNPQDAFSSNHKMSCVFINMESYAIAFQNTFQNYVSVGKHPEDI